MRQGIDVLKRGHIDLVISCFPGVIDDVKSMELLVPVVFLAGHAELGRGKRRCCVDRRESVTG